MELLKDVAVSNQLASNQRGIDALVLSEDNMEGPIQQLATQAKAYGAIGAAAQPKNNLNKTKTRTSSSCVSAGMVSRHVKRSTKSALLTKDNLHMMTTRSKAKVGSRSSIKSKSHVTQSHGSGSTMSTSDVGMTLMQQEAVLEARSASSSQRHILEKQQLMLRHHREEEEMLEKIKSRREEIARQQKLEAEKLERENKSEVETLRRIRQREIDELSMRHQRDQFEIASALEETRAERKVLGFELPTVNASDASAKKRQRRFIPTQQYAREIKQKVEEANRTWCVVSDQPKLDHEITTHESLDDVFHDDATVVERPGRQRIRTVSFSDDVTVHTYADKMESTAEESENSTDVG